MSYSILKQNSFYENQKPSLWFKSTSPPLSGYVRIENEKIMRTVRNFLDLFQLYCIFHGHYFFGISNIFCIFILN